ncbi:MAG TPA: hypothetical protein VIR29_06115 [Anseongella sp.]
MGFDFLSDHFSIKKITTDGRKIIARELGISKNTVKHYLEKAAADLL